MHYNIFFNGDSWTWGYNLKDRSKRYCELISKKLQASFTDVSDHGCSNRTILRTTLNHNISKYNLAIILLTHKNRTEFYNLQSNKWEYINMGRYNGLAKNEEIVEKMRDYYQYIYTDEYGKSDEVITYKSIKSYFKSYSIPLILITNQKKPDLQYDMKINNSNVKRCSISEHPNETGHLYIANKIYEKINQLDQSKVQNVETT